MERARFCYVVALLLVAGCGSALDSPGSRCVVDGDCAQGLTCMGVDRFPSDGGACKTSAFACSRVCDNDTHCAGLSPGKVFRCFQSCNGPSYCGQVQ
jgi:hypothetical protein